MNAKTRSYSIIAISFWVACIGSLYFHTACKWGKGFDFEGPHAKNSLPIDKPAFYHLLTLSLSKKQLSLPIDPDKNLSELKDPCNPENWRPHNILPDASYYKGKYYIYFGITPVIVLFLPWYLLNGWFFPQWIAALLFSFIGYLVSILCVIDFWEITFTKFKRGGPLGSPLNASITAISLGMGSFLPHLLQMSWVYEIAQECAYCFSMIGLWAFLRAWKSNKNIRNSCIWLFIAGFSMAMAVGSRPGFIIMGFTTLPSLVILFKSHKYRLLYWTSFIVPYIGYGLCLGLYNKLRFDKFSEFGFSYQLNNDPQFFHRFHPDLFLVNLRDYLILPPKFFQNYPYVSLRWDWLLPDWLTIHTGSLSIGGLWVFPGILLILLFPLLWKKTDEFTKKVLLILIFTGAFQLFLISSVSHCGRYIFDFMPYFVMASLIIGFISIEKLTFIWKYVALIALFFSAVNATFVSFMCSRLGWEVSISGTPAEIENHYTEVIKYNSRDAEAHFLKGLYLLKQNKNDLAIQELGEAVSLDPNYQMAMFHLANAFFVNDNKAEALNMYAAAFRIGMDATLCYKGMANIMLKVGRFNEAIKYLNIAIASSQKKDDVLLGLLQSATDGVRQKEDSIASLRYVVEQSPSNQKNLLNLGNALFEIGDEKECIPLMIKALTISSGSIELQNRLAWMLATARDHSLRNGVEALKLSLRVNNESEFKKPEYLETLAAAYAAKGEYAQAFEVCGQALELANRSQALSVAMRDFIGSKKDEEIACNLRVEMKLYKNGYPYDLPGLTSPDTSPSSSLQVTPMINSTIGSSMPIK